MEGISFMREKGVWCCTLDSVEEVTKMHSVLGDDAAKCRVVLRLYVDDHHSLIPLGSKFGCRLDEVDAILAELKKYNMPAVGVAFHVGSGNEDENAYDKAIANAKTVFDKAKQFGYSMNLLDMGGGWAGTLGGNAHRNEGLESEARIIRAALETKGMSAIPDLKLIAEPGPLLQRAGHHAGRDRHSRDRAQRPCRLPRERGRDWHVQGHGPRRPECAARGAGGRGEGAAFQNHRPRLHGEGHHHQGEGRAPSQNEGGRQHHVPQYGRLHHEHLFRRCACFPETRLLYPQVLFELIVLLSCLFCACDCCVPQMAPLLRVIIGS